jgi:hypothetical protein
MFADRAMKISGVTTPLLAFVFKTIWFSFIKKKKVGIASPRSYHMDKLGLVEAPIHSYNQQRKRPRRTKVQDDGGILT